MVVRRLLRISSITILAIFVIVSTVVAGVFVYEPSPKEGFAFSSAGNTIQLPDGRTLAYLDSGDPGGRPVFFFHGGPGSRLQGAFFDEMNQRLGIRMISPDRPGYGLSDYQEDRTYLNWPTDVVMLADELGIDRFAVLGWSSGGPHAAAVAHAIPDRLVVVAIVAGEGPYASDDFPHSDLIKGTFSGSETNELFIWSANNSPWLMQTLFRAMRIVIFSDPAGMIENSGDANMSAKDMQFFARREFTDDFVEALRQGAKGWTRDFTIERSSWPFDLREILAPTVLVFHGEEDGGVHPEIGNYVCAQIPSCDTAIVFPGEGHSVVYFRYQEIIHSVLEAWE